MTDLPLLDLPRPASPSAFCRLPAPEPGADGARTVLDDTLALVLAGGRGARLGPLTAQRAKPAMPIAGGYRLIDFTLSNCLNSGFDRVGVLTQHLADSLEPHLRQAWGAADGEPAFVECLPPHAADGYRGTADAVRQNLATILAQAPQQVLVLAGDHAYRMDYGAMLEAHRRSGARITIGCLRVPTAEARAFGVMAVDGAQRVRRFAEKPARPESLPGHPELALASMGIYVFDTAVLLDLLAADAEHPDSSHDFGCDILPAALAAQPVHAYGLRDPRHSGRQGYWRDVGTIDAYREANLELAGEAPAFDPHDPLWPVRGGGLRGDRLVRQQRSILPTDGETCGATISRSVLFPGVRVGTGSLVRDSVVLGDARIGARCLIRNAVVEEGCVIPPGTDIGIDAARDRLRFHVAEGGTVLVTPEMLAPS